MVDHFIDENLKSSKTSLNQTSSNMNSFKNYNTNKQSVTTADQGFLD